MLAWKERMTLHSSASSKITSMKIASSIQKANVDHRCTRTMIGLQHCHFDSFNGVLRVQLQWTYEASPVQWEQQTGLKMTEAKKKIVGKESDLHRIYCETRFYKTGSDGCTIDGAVRPFLPQTTIMVMMEVTKKISCTSFNFTISKCINCERCSYKA